MKMKIGVLMGGISSEREISLRSGREMLANIDTERFEPVEVVLDSRDDIFEKAKGLDFALLALHGKYGEDGTVQAVLEALGVPYSGCGVLASSMCMDKDIAKTVLRQKGVRTADWMIARSMEDLTKERMGELGARVVVKPNSGGSSVATFICDGYEEARNGLEEALKYDTEVMIERFLKGDEITVPVLDGEVLPTLMIKPQKGGFFDFTSKYEEGGAIEEIIELPEELKNEVNELAKSSYEALKCSVYARVDFILNEGKPYLLELNTLPGMTKTSLFPKSAKGIGLSYRDLITRIIDISLKVRG